MKGKLSYLEKRVHPGADKTRGVKNRSLWGTRIRIYPGQYYDSETGLHYNKWRYYDPETGRYLRVDPAFSFNANMFYPFTLFNLLETPQLINPYSYVQNQPIDWFDSKGLLRDMIDAYDDAYDHKIQRVPRERKRLNPDSPRAQCLKNAFEKLKKEMEITNKVQIGCLIKGATMCIPAVICGEGVGYGVCLKAVWTRCGVLVNIPRIPVILNWIEERQKCLKLPGDYIES